MKLATTLTILVTAFILTVILAPIAIPLLRRLKFGQSIREEGPESHLKKQVHQRWVALFSCWQLLLLHWLQEICLTYLRHKQSCYYLY